MYLHIERYIKYIGRETQREKYAINILLYVHAV